MVSQMHLVFLWLILDRATEIFNKASVGDVGPKPKNAGLLLDQDLLFARPSLQSSVHHLVYEGSRLPSWGGTGTLILVDGVTSRMQYPGLSCFRRIQRRHTGDDIKSNLACMGFTIYSTF